MSGWQVERASGAAGPFHTRRLPDPVRRSAWVLAVDRPALVLGSAQPDSVVDRAGVARAGIEVIRRHSGGGAVLLEPGAVVWVDLLLPAGDRLWHDDVGRAAWWVGEAWAAALADLGVPAAVHRGPYEPGRLGALVCFAGLGPGEVTVDGAKVVGVAQRRTRAGARFQCALLRRWRPGRLLALLDTGPVGRTEALEALTGAARGLDLEGDAVVAALLAHLPA